MRLRRAVVVCVSGVLLLPLPALGSGAPESARVQPWLLHRLEQPVADQLRVYVHADTGAHARAAARAAGLSVVETFEKVAVVVADGAPSAIRQVAEQPHVRYVEGDPPAELQLDKAHRATRNGEARATISGPSGAPLSGAGVSVAVIDTGVDGTHPFFRLPDGRSKVVANHKTLCHDHGYLLLQPAPNPSDACWAPVLSNDSDTGSAGGHGTHVAGIVGGVPTQVRPLAAPGETTASGAATGASIVALSVGAASSIYGGNTGLNWVLNHHRAPCGPGVDRVTCPPIRVTNNSYGIPGGSTFDPEGVTAKLQRALVREGVVTVWAAGNDGGDGSGKDVTGRSQRTNGMGSDPTPGIVMVASYDHGTDGTRDGQLSSSSSRGVSGSPDTYPDLAAPGDYVLSSCRVTMPLCVGFPYDGPGAADRGTFTYMGGTSMAAPYVAGVAAQLLELDPTLTPGQVEIALEDGAHRFADGAAYEQDPGNPGSPTSYDKGHGLVDVVASAAHVAGGGISVPQPETAPAYVPTPTAPGVLSCSTAFTDKAGDAKDPATKQDRNSLDLVAGRWRWDGQALTASFVVTDVAAARGAGGTGEQFVWTVLPAEGDPFDLVTSTGFARSTYLARGSSTVDVTGRVVDRPGSEQDEVQVVFTNADVAGLAGDDPLLEPGLALTTTQVGSHQLAVFVRVPADTATGDSCAYVIGAADREPAER